MYNPIIFNELTQDDLLKLLQYLTNSISNPRIVEQTNSIKWLIKPFINFDYKNGKFTEVTETMKSFIKDKKIEHIIKSDCSDEESRKQINELLKNK